MVAISNLTSLQPSFLIINYSLQHRKSTDILHCFVLLLYFYHNQLDRIKKLVKKIINIFFDH